MDDLRAVREDYTVRMLTRHYAGTCVKFKAGYHFAHLYMQTTRRLTSPILAERSRRVLEDLDLHS